MKQLNEYLINKETKAAVEKFKLDEDDLDYITNKIFNDKNGNDYDGYYKGYDINTLSYQEFVEYINNNVDDWETDSNILTDFLTADIMKEIRKAKKVIVLDGYDYDGCLGLSVFLSTNPYRYICFFRYRDKEIYGMEKIKYTDDCEEVIEDIYSICC